MLSTMRNLSKNKLQKVVDIFAQLKNSLYLCTRFDKEKSLRKSSEGSYGEFSEKKVSKIFGGYKNLPYLCTRFSSEKTGSID